MSEDDVNEIRPVLCKNHCLRADALRRRSLRLEVSEFELRRIVDECKCDGKEEENQKK